MPTTSGAITLDLGPANIRICVTRQDSKTFGWTLLDQGAPVDLTGATLQLIVNTTEDGGGTELFDISQSNVLDATGLFTFKPSTVDLDQTPGTYFHQIKWDDGAGEILTIAAGEFVIGPDIQP